MLYVIQRLSVGYHSRLIQGCCTLCDAVRLHRCSQNAGTMSEFRLSTVTFVIRSPCTDDLPRIIVAGNCNNRLGYQLTSSRARNSVLYLPDMVVRLDMTAGMVVMSVCCKI